MPKLVKGSDAAKVHMQKIRDIAKAKREALKNVSIEESNQQEEPEELEEQVEFKEQPEEANSEVSEDIEVEIKPKTMRKPRTPKVKQDVQIVKAPPRPKKKIIIEEEEEEEQVEVVYKPNKANSKPKTVKAPKKQVEKAPEVIENPLLTRRYSRN